MHVVAVTGGKGGVGKTNIAVNFAVALSKIGRDVVLFDADLGLANVDLLMGLSIQHTLADVVSGKKRISDIIVEDETGVRVIPAASGIAEMVDLPRRAAQKLCRPLQSIGNTRCDDRRYWSRHRSNRSNFRCGLPNSCARCL